MKKFILFVLILCAVSYYRVASEERKKQSPQSQTLFAKATTADGRLDLSILLASPLLPDERRAAYQEADRDGDGFLTREEYDCLPDFASKYETELTCRRMLKCGANGQTSPCPTPSPEPYAANVASQQPTPCQAFASPASPCDAQPCEQNAPVCPFQACDMTFEAPNAFNLASQQPTPCQAFASPASPASPCNAQPCEQNAPVCPFQACDMTFEAPNAMERDDIRDDIEAEIYGRLFQTLEETLVLRSSQWENVPWEMNVGYEGHSDATFSL